MKKILLWLWMSMLILSSTNAITSLSAGEIKTWIQQGYILWDNYKSYSECTSLKDQYNKEYPNYVRSECFSDGEWYKYFICQANDACTLPWGTTVQPSSVQTATTTTNVNSTTNTVKATNVPNQKQLDAFLKQLSGKEETLSWEKYEALLKSVWNKFTTLEKKYAKNATVLQMVTYLSNGVEELKVKYAQSWENDDIANFFKDLTLEDTEQVNEIASNEPKGSNTTTTTKTPTSSSSSWGSSSSSTTVTKTGTLTSPTVVQEVLPGWSKVDGPKSKYPNTEDELKFICKAGYRLPTNAEWNALRQPWAWDLFTKEAQKLWLSSAYYWTKEGDIFYVMNGESGYLNPVKSEDKERIRNIAHYTRCISEKWAWENITASGGVGQSSQVIGSALNPSLKDLQSLVWKTLSESKLVDAVVEKYISSNNYFEIKSQAKEIEQKSVSYIVTKVVDHWSNPPVKESAPNRLLTWWYGFWVSEKSMSDSVERYLSDLNRYMNSYSGANIETTQYALNLYNSRELAKQYMYIAYPSVCPEWSELYATNQFLNGLNTSKTRWNMCKVKWEEKYFTLYFNSFPEPEKVTQKYTGTLSSREYDTTKNPTCEPTKEFSVFGKKVTWTFKDVEYNFDVEAHYTLWKTAKEASETPWTKSSFSFVVKDNTKEWECFPTINNMYRKNTDSVWSKAISQRSEPYAMCPGIIFMQWFWYGDWTPFRKLGDLKEINCNYSYIYNP